MTQRRHIRGRLSGGWTGVLIGIWLLIGAQQASACTPTIACLDCQDDGNGQYTATAGQEVTFRLWPTGCAVLTTDWRVDGTTESSQTGAQYKFYYTFPEATEPGTPHTVRAVIEHDDGGTTIPAGSNTVSVDVTAGEFTVNILPSAGCTVLAGDGGIDDAEAEGNGIVCSGDTAEDDPLCTEQFQNSSVASLKVAPDEGFVFTGWTVNGAQINASIEPLFLTTMPMLAQNGDWLTPFTGNIANVQPNCSNVTLTVPTTVKRDEIFEVTLTLDPPPLYALQLVLWDLIGQTTQELPGRGTVQMYDFGYDIDGDGDIDPGQTSLLLSFPDDGTLTMKAVYNLYQPSETIKIRATVNSDTFETPPIEVTSQIRKYTTEQGYDHTNDFDEHADPLKTFQYWVDYWDDWNYPEEGEPYTFKMNGGEIEDKLTYDLAKAVCFKESHMAEVDLMQMTPVALQSLSGTAPMNDWNWSVLPDADGDYPAAGIVELHYTGVSDTTEEGSLKWGIRWLYAEKSRALNGSKPGTYRPVWDNWTTTLENYNGEPTKVQYALDVMALYRSGKNPHDGNPTYMWPIMTNGNARQ